MNLASPTSDEQEDYPYNVSSIRNKTKPVEWHEYSCLDLKVLQHQYVLGVL